VHGLARGVALRERAARVLEEVGLGADALDRHPHEFSGGQRQRIAIARALATDPEFLVCDEPVTSLDATVQAQVLQLLAERQRARGLACLFIAHDLAVVRRVADRVAVMFAGRIVERATADSLFAAPTHPYTRALLAAVPALVRDGHPPSRAERPPAVVPPVAPPPAAAGCPYAPRCAHPLKDAACASTVPPLAPHADDRRAGHLVACLKPPIADPS
jgi:oligopeptide/dipeptide ABC transporter ATP-binding protein